VSLITQFSLPKPGPYCDRSDAADVEEASSTVGAKAVRRRHRAGAPRPTADQHHRARHPTLLSDADTQIRLSNPYEWIGGIPDAATQTGYHACYTVYQICNARSYVRLISLLPTCSLDMVLRSFEASQVGLARMHHGVGGRCRPAPRPAGRRITCCPATDGTALAAARREGRCKPKWR
jgi:hypothetical protein